MVRELTDNEIISLTGWRPANAVVLRRVATLRTTAALIDTNGDGRSIEFEVLHLDDDENWRGAYSAGAGSEGFGWVQNVAFLYGYSPGKTTVPIDFKQTRTNVSVGINGWWIFLGETPTEGDRPQVAAT